MHDYEDALREVLNRVYRNTDDCEMRISKDCYKLIREALEKTDTKEADKRRVLLHMPSLPRRLGCFG